METKNFSIYLTGQTSYVNGDECALGKIEICGFVEEFEASLSYWSEKDYEHHWIESLKRLEGGAKKTGLIISMYDLKKANYIVWWVAYFDSGKILIQNQILFREFFPDDLNFDNIYDCIPEYKGVGEDGEEISQWVTDLAAITKFLSEYERYKSP